MRITLVSVMLVAAASHPVLAQHPINGTWQTDLASIQLPSKPETFEIKDGIYSCSTCTPPIRVAADNAFHAVAGRAAWNEMKVDPSRPDSVTYSYRRDGREVSTSVDTLSADGRTLTNAYRSINNAKGTPVEGSSTYARVSPAAAGAHAVSGSWRGLGVQSGSPEVSQLTFLVEGKTVTVTQPTGETYTTTVGAPFVANAGDPGKAMFQVSLPGPRMLEETIQRDGKIVGRVRYTVAPDGRSLTGRYTDLRDDSVTIFKANKR